MFCGECGTENPDTNRFCKNCGNALGKPPIPGTAVPAAAGPAVQTPQAVENPARQPVTPAVEPKPRRIWLGIVSLLVSLVSWLFYPIVLGAVAVVLGILSLILAKKKHAKFPVSAIIAIIIGLLAVILNFFWLDIFPPAAVLPPIK
jgi:energy-converting hydrogenase Eha subunit A